MLKDVFGCHSGVTELYSFFYTQKWMMHIIAAYAVPLPECWQLPTSILDILEETHVGKAEDFTFIQESDLLSGLRPVQMRKLAATWKQTSE